MGITCHDVMVCLMNVIRYALRFSHVFVILQVMESPVVSRAGKLLQSRINELALCITYPESAVMSGLPIFRAEKREKILETSVRFSTKEVGHPVLTATDLAFSVSKPVTIHGVTLYGGSEQSYTYKITILRQSKVVSGSEGKFSQGDYYGDGFVNVNLKSTVKLEVSRKPDSAPSQPKWSTSCTPTPKAVLHLPD